MECHSNNLPLSSFEDKEEWEVKVYDFEKLINAAGGFGRYQLFWFIVWFSALSGTNFFIFTLSYLELMPKLQWLTNGNFINCESKDIWDEGIVKSYDKWRVD